MAKQKSVKAKLRIIEEESKVEIFKAQIKQTKQYVFNLIINKN